MINKVTNTHCRSKIIFFLLTLYKSLKNFLLGTSNAIFFTSAFFNGYRRRSGKWCFGARPVGKMTTKFCFFMSRCCIFFLSSWFFIRDKSEADTFDGKHLEELTSKSYPGKIQDESHLWPVRLFFGWVPPGNPPVHDFDWNKSCVLKVSKLGILTSKLVLLLSDQMQEWSHSRHHFLTVTRGWLLRCHATVSI